MAWFDGFWREDASAVLFFRIDSPFILGVGVKR